MSRNEGSPEVTPRNPIVHTVPLASVPGWVGRQYADGMYDAAEIDGPGLTIGCATPGEAIAEAARLSR